MKKAITIALVLAGSAVGGCGKCGGGGGGAWLVGQDGLMVQVNADGTMGPGYDLGGTDDLFGIGCRGDDIAFVVGEGGTALRTFDGGTTWEAMDLGTTAALRDVAVAWDLVYVAGDDGVRVSTDDGSSWTLIPGSLSAWRSISTTDTGDLALMLTDDGSVWRYDGSAMIPTTSLPGARAASLSHDGQFAAVAGDGGLLAVSVDGGETWKAVDARTHADLLSVAAGPGGEVIAVGTGGTVVHMADDAVDTSTLASDTLRAVRLDGDEGFAAGDGGELLVTHDAGDTWEVQPVTLGGSVFDLDDL